MKRQTVTVYVEEYNHLLDEKRILEALREYGVDNWEGYGEALSSLTEEE